MKYIKALLITALSLMSVKSFAASEGGGLPQMDISSYSSQIFWLIVTFGILYIFMWKIAIPQLRTTVEERKDKISNDLSDYEISHKNLPYPGVAKISNPNDLTEYIVVRNVKNITNSKLQISENLASLTSVTYKKFGDVSMGENRVHGFQNWGTHDFYTEYNNFQDTMITNPNPSIQRGVGYNQIDLTNKILFKLNARTLSANIKFISGSNF